MKLILLLTLLAFLFKNSFEYSNVKNITYNNLCNSITVNNSGILYNYKFDWDGYVYAINDTDSSIIWKRSIYSYREEVNYVMRLFDMLYNSKNYSCPVFMEGIIFVGNQMSSELYAINATDGNLIWKNTLDNNSISFINKIYSVVCNNKTCDIIVGLTIIENPIGLIMSDRVVYIREYIESVNIFSGKANWKTLIIERFICSVYTELVMPITEISIDTKRNVSIISVRNIDNPFEQNLNIILDLYNGSIIWSNSNKSNINNTCIPYDSNSLKNNISSDNLDIKKENSFEDISQYMMDKIKGIINNISDEFMFQMKLIWNNITSIDNM